MKLGVLISGLSGGGAERVCRTLIGEFRDMRELDLAVCSVKPLSDGVLREPELEGLHRIHSLDANHARTAVKGLWAWLSSERPDVVLVFNHQLAVLLVILRWLGRKRFSIIARHINTLSQKRAQETSWWHRYIVHGLTRWLYRYCDGFIAQSHGMKQDMVSFSGLPEDRISVIHNPVAEMFFGELGDSGKRNGVLFIGRLAPQKGIDRLQRIGDQLLHRRQTIRLTVVGGGTLDEDVRQWGRRQARVVYAGESHDVMSFYRSAKCVVLTSYYEGFPNVLVESLACGTPVVSFDCPSGPAEIITSDNGILVKDGDEEGFVDAVEQVLTGEFSSSSARQSVAHLRAKEVALSYMREIERYIS